MFSATLYAQGEKSIQSLEGTRWVHVSPFAAAAPQSKHTFLISTPPVIGCVAK
jgi:hypothetical protein